MFYYHLWIFCWKCRRFCYNRQMFLLRPFMTKISYILFFMVFLQARRRLAAGGGGRQARAARGWPASTGASAGVAGKHGHEHGRRECGRRAWARARTARGWASTGADADGTRMAGEHGFERGRRRVAGKHGLRETGGEHGDLPFFSFFFTRVWKREDDSIALSRPFICTGSNAWQRTGRNFGRCAGA